MSPVRSSDQVARSFSVLTLKLRVDGLRSAREGLPYREAEPPPALPRLLSSLLLASRVMSLLLQLKYNGRCQDEAQSRFRVHCHT